MGLQLRSFTSGGVSRGGVTVAAIAAVLFAACGGNGSHVDGGTAGTGGSSGRGGTTGGGGAGGGTAGNTAGASGAAGTTGAGGSSGAGGTAGSAKGGGGGSGGASGSSGASGAAGSAKGGGGGSGGSGGAGGSPCRAQGQSCSQSEPCCIPLICAGACTIAPSDRNLKRDFAPVKPDEILEELSSLPISTWSYKTEDPSARHIGPMAQDFMAKFGVGSSDKVIFQVDADGVAFAAIQALDARVKQLEKQNADLSKELARVRREVSHRRAPERARGR